MGRQARAKRGIIDLGSNTIRLVIYQVKLSEQSKDGKPETIEDFKMLLNEKRVVGLSSYVEDGSLSPAGIEKAADVLERHITLAANMGCTDVRLFATAVIRNLANRKQAVQELERLIGKHIDVLTGREESHLGFIGAKRSASFENGLLVDIGGGSTELAFIKDGKDCLNYSIDQGCVSSYANFVRCIFPTEKEQKAIRNAFEARLQAQEDLPHEVKGNMYCIGGSVRAIAKFHARMLESDKSSKSVTLDDVDRILSLAKKDEGTFAHLATKAVPDRIHTIMPGCIILKTLMKRYDKTSLTICKYGVREGYLLSRL